MSLPYDQSEVAELARQSGPWTEGAAESAKFLRELSSTQQLTDLERKALAVLRYRETMEATRIRRSAALREP